MLSRAKLHAKGMHLYDFKDFQGDRDKKNRRTKRSNRNLRRRLKQEDRKELAQL